MRHGGCWGPRGLGRLDGAGWLCAGARRSSRAYCLRDLDLDLELEQELRRPWKWRLMHRRGQRNVGWQRPVMRAQPSSTQRRRPLPLPLQLSRTLVHPLGHDRVSAGLAALLRTARRCRRRYLLLPAHPPAPACALPAALQLTRVSPRPRQQTQSCGGRARWCRPCRWWHPRIGVVLGFSRVAHVLQRRTAARCLSVPGPVQESTNVDQLRRSLAHLPWHHRCRAAGILPHDMAAAEAAAEGAAAGAAGRRHPDVDRRAVRRKPVQPGGVCCHSGAAARGHRCARAAREERGCAGRSSEGRLRCSAAHR